MEPGHSWFLNRQSYKPCYKYLSKYKLLHHSQSGFREKNSCQTALINLIDTWLEGIDNNELVGTLFIDLTKAFDLVDHEILLYKLSILNVSVETLQWFKSYLTDRSQIVKSSSCDLTSEPKTVLSGVPQGSILGPLLFIIYINDLPLSSTNCSFDMYADDTTIHVKNNQLSNVEEMLQNSLENVLKWCENNNMKVNLQKTTSMLVNGSRKHSSEFSLKLNARGLSIDNVNAQKVLGIIRGKCVNYAGSDSK